MTEHRIPGSGNSLVGSTDDGMPSYRELQRCKHCLKPMALADALDDVHDECLKNERLAWNCNEEGCEHSWEQLGIPMTCPVCNHYNIDSATSIRLDRAREVAVEKYLRDMISSTPETYKAIAAFK